MFIRDPGARAYKPLPGSPIFHPECVRSNYSNIFVCEADLEVLMLFMCPWVSLLNSSFFRHDPNDPNDPNDSNDQMTESFADD